MTPDEITKTTFIIPCLYESRSRCTETNPHELPIADGVAEKPMNGDQTASEIENYRTAESPTIEPDALNVFVYPDIKECFAKVLQSRTALLRGSG